MKILINSKEKRSLARSLVSEIRGEQNMEVIIQPHIENKSDEQRGWFHVLCRELAADTGYTPGQVKEAIKKHILGTETIILAGKAVEVTSSSEVDEDGKARSKPSYSQLIEGAYQVAGEAGITLPSPMRRAG